MPKERTQGQIQEGISTEREARYHFHAKQPLRLPNTPRVGTLSHGHWRSEQLVCFVDPFQMFFLMHTVWVDEVLRQLGWMKTMNNWGKPPTSWCASPHPCKKKSGSLGRLLVRGPRQLGAPPLRGRRRRRASRQLLRHGGGSAASVSLGFYLLGSPSTAFCQGFNRTALERNLSLLFTASPC